MSGRFINSVPVADSRDEVCRLFRINITWLVLVLVLVQVALDTSIDNVVSVAIAAFGSLLVVWVMLRPAFFGSTALSAFILVVNMLVNFIFPMAFTLVEGRSLVYRLQHPVVVFGYLSGSVVLLIISFLFYRYCMNAARARLQFFALRRGFFAPLTPAVITIGSILGVAALIYSNIVGEDLAIVSSSASGFLAKISDGFKPFAFFPILLLFPRLSGSNRSVSIVTFALVGVVSAVIFFVSIASNVRGLIGVFLVSIVLLVFLSFLCGTINYLRFNLVQKVGAIVLALGIAIAIGHLATAMELARSSRGEISKLAMAKTTLENCLDFSAIQSHRARVAEESSTEGWSEAYLLNPVYNRLVGINFNDNVLNLADWVTPEISERLRDFSYDRFWATLPGPLLARLGLNIDKVGVYSISNGSYLLAITTGNRDGDFKSAALVPFGVIQFGFWFWPGLFVISILVYVIMDSFVCPLARSGGLACISPIALVLIYSITMSFQGEALLDIVGIGLRLFYQSIIFYWLLNLVFGAGTNLKRN